MTDDPGSAAGRRTPSASGEGVEGVPVLERTPVESEGLVTVESSDLTAWCPYEGTADFYTVRIEYVPDGWAVELMSLRDYFGSYRGEEIGHEALASRVYEQLLALLEPAWLRLVVDCPPRYGLETTIRHQTGPAPTVARESSVEE